MRPSALFCPARGPGRRPRPGRGRARGRGRRRRSRGHVRRRLDERGRRARRAAGPRAYRCGGARWLARMVRRRQPRVPGRPRHVATPAAPSRVGGRVTALAVAPDGPALRGPAAARSSRRPALGHGVIDVGGAAARARDLPRRHATRGAGRPADRPRRPAARAARAPRPPAARAGWPSRRSGSLWVLAGRRAFDPRSGGRAGSISARSSRAVSRSPRTGGARTPARRAVARGRRSWTCAAVTSGRASRRAAGRASRRSPPTAFASMSATPPARSPC